MTVARLLTYWISTVLIGSFLAPIILSIGFGGLNDIFGIMLISVIISFIASLPAILVFYVVLTYQYDKNIHNKQKERTLMWTHLGCSLATFIFLWSFIGSSEVIPAVAVFFCTYTGIGMLFWYYEFRTGWEKTEEIEQEPVVKADEESVESF